MRAIDADAFIEYLKQSMNDAILSSLAQPEGVFLCTRIVAGFENDLRNEDVTPTIKLPASPQWIPVTERLPEKTGMYITTTMYGEVYYDYWNGDNFGRCETVIAWMNPPEPYKGGEQDGQND